MTVDLSKAKPGDKLVFRCGGTAEIRSIGPSNSKYYPIAINILHYHLLQHYWTYNSEGELGDGTGPDDGCPFDIINIKPKLFDWSTVKPGMAFQVEGSNRQDTYYYIGEDFLNHRCAVFARLDADPAPLLNDLQIISKDGLVYEPVYNWLGD